MVYVCTAEQTMRTLALFIFKNITSLEFDKTYIFSQTRGLQAARDSEGCLCVYMFYDAFK